jgi:PIN domain nuclease of toxin-antitoxin system
MVVIDTHVLVWWVNGADELSNAASRAIENTLKQGNEVIVSAISAWEIAMLVVKNRLILKMDVADWLHAVTQVDGIRLVPVDYAIGMQAPLLPGVFHKDPADRMIVATARKLAAPLITADEKIRDYVHVQTIW